MTGPTGVGKSRFAVALAERLGGEIIGADAFQIYAGLPVLTAQPSPEALAAVPHHLIGFLDLRENFDAARYTKAARACIEDIQFRGKLPILVGGTGLYLKALIHGLAAMPATDPVLRATIAQMPLEQAIESLRKKDAAALSQIDLKNPVRVHRALEIVLLTGRPLAESRGGWNRPSNEFRGIVLIRNREELNQRIMQNVAELIANGAIEEVRAARHAGSGASRAIGFQEIQAFLQGRKTLEACREEIATATRRYAKRQLTWCRTQFNFPHLDLTALEYPRPAITHPIEQAIELLHTVP